MIYTLIIDDQKIETFERPRLSMVEQRLLIEDYCNQNHIGKNGAELIENGSKRYIYKPFTKRDRRNTAGDKIRGIKIWSGTQRTF